MSWWVPMPPLAPDETVLWQHAASRLMRIRLVGGRLLLTRYRLIFVPNRLEAAFGASAWMTDNRDVMAVLPEKGLRRKLRIDVSAGPEALFFVTQVDRSGQEIVAHVNAVRAAKSSYPASTLDWRRIASRTPSASAWANIDEPP